jgi:hypothetical protein
MPQTLPPMKEDPGRFMVQQVKRALPKGVRENISHQAEQIAAKALGFGYGTLFAASYAASRREPKNILLEGSALGLATWAAGYLGWLPATELMPPVWKQKPRQVIPGIFSHLGFGILCVGIFSLLRKKAAAQ